MQQEQRMESRRVNPLFSLILLFIQMLFSQFEDSAVKIQGQYSLPSENSPSSDILSPYDIISSYLNQQAQRNSQPHTKQFSLYISPKLQQQPQFSAVEELSKEQSIFDLEDRLSAIKDKPENGRVRNGLDYSDCFVSHWLTHAQARHSSFMQANIQSKAEDNKFYAKQNDNERCYQPVTQFYFVTSEPEIKRKNNIPSQNKCRPLRKGIRLSVARKFQQ